MSTDDLQEVLSRIRNRLTAAERRKVLVMIRSLDGEEASAALQPSHSDDWLLPGLEHELRKKGLLMTPLSPARLQSWAPNYHRDIVPLQRGLMKKFKENPTRAEQLAFGRLCASCLYDYLATVANQGTYPLGPALMLRRIAEVPAALEAAFPGYLTAGMISKVMR